MYNVIYSAGTPAAKGIPVALGHHAPLATSHGHWPDQELLIGPATSFQQHRACNALIRRMYEAQGYKVSVSQRRLGDPDHVTFGAWQNGELQATISVSRDSRNGLAADTLYREELDTLRNPSTVLCEFTRLAVDTACKDLELIRSLFRAAHQYARTIFGGTDAVIEVNPRHVGYYCRLMGFKQLGNERQCKRVEAPAVLLHRRHASLLI
ncbi:MAG: hypothetical protein H6R14_2402 [Proteobacteria bacterium]|nr:hypothetical protein [Pseudomonadota bacterium]